MKKNLFCLIVSLVLCLPLFSCSNEGGNYQETYEFLTYTVPEGYTRSGDSEEPFYTNSEYTSIYITIETDEYGIGLDEMLSGRLESDEFTEVTVLDDYVVDNIAAKQYDVYHVDMETEDLNISFIYEECLVTFTLMKAEDTEADAALTDFSIFLESVVVGDENND